MPSSAEDAADDSRAEIRRHDLLAKALYYNDNKDEAAKHIKICLKLLREDPHRKNTDKKIAFFERFYVTRAKSIGDTMMASGITKHVEAQVRHGRPYRVT